MQTRLAHTQTTAMAHKPAQSVFLTLWVLDVVLTRPACPSFVKAIHHPPFPLGGLAKIGCEKYGRKRYPQPIKAFSINLWKVNYPPCKRIASTSFREVILNTLNTSDHNHRSSNTTSGSMSEHYHQTAAYQDHDTLFNELSEQEIHTAIKQRYSTAAKLARNAPKPYRCEMEKLFNISLFIHKRFEQIHNLPKQDINGAITIFLYGVWSLHNQCATIPGSSFSNLIENTRQMLEKRGDFLKEYEKANNRKQQSLYETFSMIGNWLLMIQHHLTSQPQNTALNNIKDMIYEIITRSLKINPETIVIRQDGQLTLAPRPAAKEHST
jgi:hypothetical protein